jgi:hypothetical protein
MSLTHAVTERSAGLLYYNQSGAMNESFSDIFGETIDLDRRLRERRGGVRWNMGEDLPIGAIRNMMNPNTFGDPGQDERRAYFKCRRQAWTDPTRHGGVHRNSGIPNHAYALMVDGGTYQQARTITGIGTTKAAKIEYRALTTVSHLGLGVPRRLQRLNQSCTDLIGRPASPRGLHAGQPGAAGGRDERHVGLQRRHPAPAALSDRHACVRSSRTISKAVTSNWTASTTAPGSGILGLGPRPWRRVHGVRH